MGTANEPDPADGAVLGLRTGSGGTSLRLALVVCVAVAIGLVAEGRANTVEPRDVLEDCVPGEGPREALCGRIPVFEDRQSGTGRKIELNVLVYPALSREPQPDPVFFLAGGPGQAATTIGPVFANIFRNLREHRDLVFVDQRGTGKSNGLQCDLDSDDLQTVFSDEQAVERLRQCLERYDADPRHYTTPIAMDDLDEVRDRLGYRSINLWGGSYGTRAALVFLRRHGEHVRSVVLDGVVPMAMTLPGSFPDDFQRALDLTLGACEMDEACRKRFPDLRRNLGELLDRLERRPIPVREKHPRTGEIVEFELRRSVFADVIGRSLYASEGASLIPMVIDMAYQGDFSSVMALALIDEVTPVEARPSLGMFFSVVCAEDWPWFDSEQWREGQPVMFRDESLVETWTNVCSFWPTGTVPEGYRQPVRSDKPVLVLSGSLDPVTPPRWGEKVLESLSNTRHVVVPGVGHGTSFFGCLPSLIADFINGGSLDGLDSACVSNLNRAPFFLTQGGPSMEPDE